MKLNRRPSFFVLNPPKNFISYRYICISRLLLIDGLAKKILEEFERDLEIQWSKAAKF